MDVLELSEIINKKSDTLLKELFYLKGMPAQSGTEHAKTPLFRQKNTEVNSPANNS